MKNIYLIIFLICISAGLSFLMNNYLLTDNLYYLYFQDQYSYTKIGEMIEVRKKWRWLSYLSNPIILLISIQIPVIMIYLGMYISKFSVKYGDVLKATLLAHFIFLIPILLKIIWFSYYPVSMDALRHFHPLSLFSLFDPELLQVWLYYSLKTLNIFEIASWLVLAFFLAKFLKKSFDEMLKIVVLYYGTFLVCWIVFVMFISISNS